ncbi:MAG: diaminopimelate epimerase [Puniceicoccales bacterium]|jgi:diaminopimelate epimerase|nr:diaminopimelate epimerase [Puniceicoccales bacterium]
MKLVKYHALGNDYLFIDSAKEVFPGPKFVKQICHRNFGIGSDGILYGGISGEKFAVTIINPDASVAEISGNGVRIFARAMLDCGNVAIGNEFCVRTGPRQVMCKIKSANEISVDMGTPLFSAPNLPVGSKFGHKIIVNGRQYVCYPVSMGNPHCVIFVDELAHEHVLSDGQILENNPAFTERTNVQFAHIIDRNNIGIEIWERGAGYTLASGSSACGVFAVARRLHSCAPAVSIHMTGGILHIEETKSGTILQTGSVEKIAECIIA